MKILYAIPPRNLPEDLNTIDEQIGFGWSGAIAKYVNKLLSAVTHEQVLRYLDSSDIFQREDSNQEGVLRFEVAEDFIEDATSAVLIEDHYVDYRIRLEELLNVISKSEKRPIEEIVAEIRGESVESLISFLFSDGKDQSK